MIQDFEKKSLALSLIKKGIKAKEQGEIEKSMRLLLEATKLDRACSKSYWHIGQCLSLKNNYSEALIYFKKAISINPEDSEYFFMLALHYHALGSYDLALKTYSDALSLKKEYNDAIRHNAFLNLLMGNYKKGLESSFSKDVSKTLHSKEPSMPIWEGEVLTKDDHLIVVTNDGYGDTIHHLRYIKTLLEKGIKLSICSLRKFHVLLNNTYPELSIIQTNEIHLLSEGKWVPLSKLILYLNVIPKKTIIDEPYLKYPKNLYIKWKRKLSIEKKPIVGINWQGNLRNERSLLTRGRSFSLMDLLPLSVKNDFKFLSLQKGAGAEELKCCSFRDQFVECQDEISQTFEFEECAAIIDCCDLVITSDTYVAHLAGAIGKKTWLLLKYVPAWQWGLNSEKTFWYPSLRLFRQQKIGDWTHVMKNVVKELRNIQYIKS